MVPSFWKNSLPVPQKVKIGLLYDLKVPFLMYPQNENMCLHEVLHTNVDSNIIHNKKVKTMQMSMNMDKQNVV